MSLLSTFGFGALFLVCLLGGAACGADPPPVAHSGDVPCTFGRDFPSGACANAPERVALESTTSADTAAPRSAKDLRKKSGPEVAQVRVAPVHPPASPPRPRPPRPPRPK